VFLVAVDSIDGWFEGNVPNHAATARAIDEGDAKKARKAMEQVLGYTQSKLSSPNAAAGQRNVRLNGRRDLGHT
jgi:GntR family galactonate operon transcriptional repressor